MSLALKLALSPLLVAQALHARRRAPVLPEHVAQSVWPPLGGVSRP
jgi:hypothetical protein